MAWSLVAEGMSCKGGDQATEGLIALAETTDYHSNSGGTPLKNCVQGTDY